MFYHAFFNPLFEIRCAHENIRVIFLVVTRRLHLSRNTSDEECSTRSNAAQRSPRVAYAYTTRLFLARTGADVVIADTPIFYPV
ncbi:hypothetical protein PoB_006843400 [Plakobranchus ocellatus]|uniref:Uncharacterized protein n=1 Tax=Plakobranchus ocellatus TaxID=259542 RepID=A0AAV4DCK2_9GAST|nr:hypothetical protein PoB_006843400 [Plakobranchus ocellatus]